MADSDDKLDDDEVSRFFQLREACELYIRQEVEESSISIICIFFGELDFVAINRMDKTHPMHSLIGLLYVGRDYVVIERTDLLWRFFCRGLCM